MSTEASQKFNLDELEPPKFLTEEFIRKFLVDAEKDDELRVRNRNKIIMKGREI